MATFNVTLLPANVTVTVTAVTTVDAALKAQTPDAVKAFVLRTDAPKVFRDAHDGPPWPLGVTVTF